MPKTYSPPFPSFQLNLLNGTFQIFWSGSGTLVTITSEDSYYVLRFDRDAYNEKIEAGADLGDEGVEEAFDLVAEISEKYTTCFLNLTGHS